MVTQICCYNVPMGMYRAKGALSLVLLLMLVPFVARAQSEEAAVRSFFAATPVMVDIARCESEFRQFNDSGTVLHGGMGGKMIGVFQIYEDVHAEYAKAQKMDIYSLEGNLAYAKYLYDTQGTSPWLSSFPCWNVSGSSAAETSAISDHADAITMNLSMGMEHAQVMLLQKKLNEKGYTVAKDGPGSVGNETTMFGALTRAAVRAYQCAEKIACDGDEHSTGYGYVGLRTRAALESRFVAPPLSIAAPAPASEYSAEQQAQINALQAQILELTKVLNALLATRSSR